MLELQSIATVIATALLIAATIAQSVISGEPIVTLIVVSFLFIIIFFINVLIHVHRKRDQDWFVVRKCRSHLEAFQRHIEQHPLSHADFARLDGTIWTHRDGGWQRVPTNMLATGDVIGLLPDETTPCRVRNSADGSVLERGARTPQIGKADSVNEQVMQRLTRHPFVVEESPAVVQLLDSLRDPARISPASPLSQELNWLTSHMSFAFFFIVAVSFIANLLRFLLIRAANPWYQALLYDF